MKGTFRSIAMALIVAAALLGTALSAFAVGIPVEPAGVPTTAFEPSDACYCHFTLSTEWAKSMHSKSLSDPVYIAKLAAGDKATGGKLSPFCKKCHGPGGTMTGEIAQGGALSAGTAEGINCSFCHQVSGLKPGLIGNTSQLVEPGGAGGVRRAQLKDPKAPHKAQYSELHTKAEFCGACHNVMHPVNGMHLESTYNEWVKSPYAEKGIVCQDCHMSKRPGVRGPSSGQAATGAPKRDNIYHMTFVGGNVAQSDPIAATELLKSAAEIKLTVPEIVAPGQTASATVTITNKGAGHYLPTGLTEVREMWLDVSAADASGETTTFGTHVFGTILQDAKGNFPVELWDATKIKSDDRIPPQGSVTYSYAFTMPAGVKANSVQAALRYKSTPDKLAEEAGVKNPTTDMAVSTQAVYADQAAKDAASKPSAPVKASGIPVGIWIAIAAAVLVLGGAGFAIMRRA